MRQHFENMKNNRTIAKSVFQRALMELNLKSIEGDIDKRRKLESVLEMDHEPGYIDFQLLVVCINEFENATNEMSMYPSSTDKILSRLLKHFNYDILEIGKFFDINGDKELSKAEFKVMCKNLIKEVEDNDI